MECLMCLQMKTPREFYRVKHFKNIKEEKVQWCRGCQRIYKKILEQEQRTKKMKEEGFILTFN